MTVTLSDLKGTEFNQRMLDYRLTKAPDYTTYLFEKFDIPSKKLSIFMFIKIYLVSIIKLLDLPKKTHVRYMRPDWLRYLEISLLVIISLTLLMVMGCLCRKCCIWCECCDDDDDENYNKTEGV